MVENMIRIFDSGSTSFATNGIGTLTDAESCTVVEERNGEYELEMSYPVTGRRYSELKLHRIIVAKPNPFSDPQPFRIYAISKPLGGVVTVNAEHISYDLRGCIVSPMVVNTASVAFRQMKESCVPSCPFSLYTDVDTYAPLSIQKPVSMRSALCGSDVSAMNSFGGEFEFDGYSIRLLKNRGQNRGVTIRYGKNMTDFQQDEDSSEVFTGVYPFWYSEQDGLMDLAQKTVYADGTYDFVRILPLDLSEEFSEKPSEEALREAAVKYIKDNNIGVPKVSFTVSFVQLSHSDEYEKYALLEELRLCDTIKVEFPEYGVSADSKCIKTTYNVITGKYDSIELGDAKTDFASTVVVQKQTLDAQQKALATDTPTKSFMQEAIEHATKMITGGLGGYVVFNSSTGGEYPDEILIMDTDNINTAKNVWRWNKGGLGHSSNGYGGPFETAITMDGYIVGKHIAANSVNAEQLSVEYKDSVTREISNATSDLKKEVDKEFEDVGQQIDDINTEIETTVADGIVTESEKAAINKMLQVLQKEKEEADAKYDEIIQNTSIPSSERTSLTSKYTALYGAQAGSAYNSLVSSIQSVLDSQRETLDQRMNVYRAAYQTYSTKVSEFCLALDAVVEAIANQYARDYADKIKEAVDKEFGDVEKNIADLNASIENVASDGVITESEKAAISKMLQIVEKEKEEAYEQYEKLYNDGNLIKKTDLASAYTAVYGASGTQAYNKLVSSINKVLNSANKDAVDANMAIYRTDYDYYSEKLAALKLALANATEQIANAYAKSVSETTTETKLEAYDGQIRSYVSETVIKSTTIQNDDGTTSTIQEAIKAQQTEINQNAKEISLKVSNSEFGTKFTSSITAWWNNIKIESSKIDLTAIQNQIDSKVSSTELGSKVQSAINLWWSGITISSSKIDLTAIQNQIDSKVSSTELSSKVQSAISVWWNGITISSSKIKLEGYTTINGAFSVDTSGNMTATGGKIGGWTITENAIHRGCVNVEFGDPYGIYFGTGGISFKNQCKISSQGYITATYGNIAGWTLSNSCFYRGSKIYGENGRGNIYLGTSGISLSDTFKVSSAGALESTSGKIGGWEISGSYLRSTDGTVTLTSSGSIKIGSSILSSNGHGIKITNGLELRTTASSGFSDGTNTFMLYGLGSATATSTYTLGVSNGTYPIVCKQSSSSKRYKDHISFADIEDVEKLLDIPVVWFKYKDGYLIKGDRMEGKPIIGLYAEDVFDCLPQAAKIDDDGKPEDWDYRVLVPAMLKLIQNLYRKEAAV